MINRNAVACCHYGAEQRVSMKTRYRLAWRYKYPSSFNLDVCFLASWEQTWILYVAHYLCRDLASIKCFGTQCLAPNFDLKM